MLSFHCSSDYDDEENGSDEEDNSEELDSALINEEFVIDSPVEESVETYCYCTLLIKRIEIDLTQNQIGQPFSFSVVQLGKCFVINATSHTTMDSVIREIEVSFSIIPLISPTCV